MKKPPGIVKAHYKQTFFALNGKGSIVRTIRNAFWTKILL